MNPPLLGWQVDRTFTADIIGIILAIIPAAIIPAAIILVGTIPVDIIPVAIIPVAIIQVDSMRVVSVRPTEVMGYGDNLRVTRNPAKAASAASFFY